MKTKTIRLSDDYRLHDGSVEVFKYLGGDNVNEVDNYGWVKTKYVVGVQAILVSHSDVSPNLLRLGKNNERFSLVFNTDGIGGNSDQSIKKYHGWRGTTNNVSCYAHGLREIKKINVLKNGCISITVGQDLTPDQD